MAATVTTLKLKAAGIGTADLMDGDNYHLRDNGYSPGVPLRSNSPLSGRLYSDVAESIRINVRGEDGPTVHANLKKLADLLDNVDQYRMGISQNPTILEIQPKGSDLTDPIEFVLTRSPNRGGLVELPMGYNDLLMVYEVPDVRLNYERSGLGISDSDDQGPTTGAEVPSIHTLTWSESISTPCPVDLLIDDFTDVNIRDFHLFWAMHSDELLVLEAEDGDWETGEAAVEDESANNASGGDVVRFTPTSTDFTHLTFTNPGINNGIWDIFALCRVNDDVEFRAYVQALGNSGDPLDGASSYESSRTRYTQIPYNSGAITPIRLGTLYNPDSAWALRVWLQAADISGSPSIDIDYLVAIRVDNDVNRVLKVLASATHQPDQITIYGDPQNRTPYILAETDTGYQTYLGYEGNARLAMTGDTLLATFMMPGSGEWVCDGSGGATQNITLTATRYRGHTILE